MLNFIALSLFTFGTVDASFRENWEAAGWALAGACAWIAITCADRRIRRLEEQLSFERAAHAVYNEHREVLARLED